MDQESLLRNNAIYQKSWIGWSCDHVKKSSRVNTSSPGSQSDVNELGPKRGGLKLNKQKAIQGEATQKLQPETSKVVTGNKPKRTSSKSPMPMIHVSTDPLSSRRTQRSTRRRPWTEKVPSAPDRSEDFEMGYEAFLPKDKWVEYKTREYVTNPRYGQLYELRKEKPRPKPEEPQAHWLWENKFRLWRLEQANPGRQTRAGLLANGAISEVSRNEIISSRTAQSFDLYRPHADLFAAYHNQKLTNQRRDLAATVIQRRVRGWLVRKRIKDMKRQALLGLGRAWPKVTQDYRQLVTRIQARHGVMKTSCPFSLADMQDYLDQREKYEQAFEKIATGNKLSRDQLMEFLHQCGHFPTEGEITAAFNAVFRGSGSTAEVVFVLDCSSSVGEDNFRDLMTFVKDVVRMLPIGSDRVRVGLVPFNTDVFQSFGLLQHSTADDLLRAIDRIEFRPGLTHTDAALRVMMDVFKDSRPGVQKVAIVITDGQSANSERTALEAKRAAHNNITVFAVGVGDNVQRKELEGIARDATRVLTCSNYRALIQLKQVVGSKLCLHISQADMGSETAPSASTSTSNINQATTARSGTEDSPITSPSEFSQEATKRSRTAATLPTSGSDSSLTHDHTLTNEGGQRLTPNFTNNSATGTITTSNNDRSAGVVDIQSMVTTTTTSDRAPLWVNMKAGSSESTPPCARGSVKDVCRPLTRHEALDVVWTLHPLSATGLETPSSRWIRPLVDGEAAWALLDESIIKATDFKICLGLVVKSRLEREGVITLPSDVRAGVEEVTTYEEAMQKIEDYLSKRKRGQATTP